MFDHRGGGRNRGDGLQHGRQLSGHMRQRLLHKDLRHEPEPQLLQQAGPEVRLPPALPQLGQQRRPLHAHEPPAGGQVERRVRGRSVLGRLGQDRQDVGQARQAGVNLWIER